MEIIVEQRTMSAEEADIARSLFGWQFWFGPAVFTVGTVLAVVLADEVGLRVTFALTLGILTAAMWTNRIRQYRPLSRDLAKGVVYIFDGAIESVAEESGLVWAHLGGIVLRIPNDRYLDIREGTTARLTFLPESRIAVGVEVHYGIGPLVVDEHASLR